MPKNTFWSDTFEKAAEAGSSMAKAGAKQVKQTFDPRKMIENALGVGSPSGQDKMQREMKEAQTKKPNMTPLDFAKLQGKYDEQDRGKTDALRNRLFQMVKSNDEKALNNLKTREAENQKQILLQEQEKKRRQQQQIHQSQSAAQPQGKERKNIMGGKKKKTGMQPAPAELKPSSGKQ